MKRLCIPPEHSGAFVQAMEDVLEVYHLPCDPDRSLVCFDETSKQLVEHSGQRVPAIAGQPRPADDKYKRCGTANVFLAVEPLTGLVLVQATRRTGSVECAQQNETEWRAARVEATGRASHHAASMCPTSSAHTSHSRRPVAHIVVDPQHRTAHSGNTTPSAPEIVGRPHVAAVRFATSTWTTGMATSAFALA